MAQSRFSPHRPDWNCLLLQPIASNLTRISENGNN
jgi:hypothetical protein